MSDIDQYASQVLILFTFPLIGLLFERYLSPKWAYWIMGISFILFSPIFFSYQYIIPYAFRLLLLTITSIAFGLYLQRVEGKNKIVQAVVVSICILVPLAYKAILYNFLSSTTVEKSWHVQNYRIEYIENKGFSGRPLLKYDLSKYSIIPLLIKKVETIVESDTATNCQLEFPETGIVFDKCNRSIHKMTPRSSQKSNQTD